MISCSLKINSLFTFSIASLFFFSTYRLLKIIVFVLNNLFVFHRTWAIDIQWITTNQSTYHIHENHNNVVNYDFAIPPLSDCWKSFIRSNFSWFFSLTLQISHYPNFLLVYPLARPPSVESAEKSINKNIFPPFFALHWRR